MPLPIILEGHDADSLFHVVCRLGNLFPPLLAIAGCLPATVMVKDQGKGKKETQIPGELRHSAQRYVSMETDRNN
jgi:hypothetical protein